MGFKRVAVLSLVVGSAVAALLARPKRAEAPAAAPGEGAPAEPAPPAETSGLRQTLDRVKQHAEEAIEAAHEAQAEKEAELRREFDAARHKTS